MFLVGPLRRGGPTHPTVVRAGDREPEALALAQRIVAEADHPLTTDQPLAAAVATIWDDLQPAAAARARRREI